MFPYNILLNIKSGITPVKSRDSATLFLFNCRRWDYTVSDVTVKLSFVKIGNFPLFFWDYAYFDMGYPNVRSLQIIMMIHLSNIHSYWYTYLLYNMNSCGSYFLILFTFYFWLASEQIPALIASLIPVQVFSLYSGWDFLFRS